MKRHLIGCAGLALIALGCVFSIAALIFAGCVCVTVAAVWERNELPDTEAADDASSAEITESLEWHTARDLEALADRQHAADLRYWSERHGANSREFVEVTR